METLSVALWATNLEPPVNSVSAWLAQVDARVAEAQAAGAHLLVMPEFACVQWLSFAPAGLVIERQVAWLASLTQEALAAVRRIAARYGVAIVPGTMPQEIYSQDGVNSQYVNRAWLLLPDGQEFYQDKLFLTPSEQNPVGWLLTPGNQINVINWEGLRIAIVICLDMECTALFERLAKLDLDLIISPTKTDLLSGYYRVFGCAKARAIELQTAVCVVGAVGTAFGHPAVDTVVGGAAAFLPCEASLGYHGVAAALEPHAASSGLSPLLHVPHLPLAQCRRIRHGEAEAEVWPGSWTAEHIAVVDPAKGALPQPRFSTISV
jgi:predicted amidohydrolase